MEANDNVELIQLAIQRLIEDKKKKKKKKNRGIISSGSSPIRDINDDDDDGQLLLSRLISQLESLKADGMLKKDDAGKANNGSTQVKADDIVKELRKVKRQNLVTHCLLSAMIVITLAWQLSQVSLILKIKDGLKHPFRSFGSMLTGMLKLKGPAVNGMIGQDENKESSSAKQPKIEAPSIPPLKIPDLPHMDLSSLGLNGDED